MKQFELNRIYYVNVTREDIDNGIKNQSTCCPIALAVCRTLGSLSEDGDVEVDGDINLVNEPINVEVIHSYSPDGRIMTINKFINAFDKEELVFPFAFGIRMLEKPYENEDDYSDDYD